MKLEYENGTLRVENAEGLRWQLANVEKPRFAFEYDALSVTDERALRRIGTSMRPLAESEVRQVKALIEQLPPPSWATFQKQMTVDLRAFAHGLVNSVVMQLECDGLLDVAIKGRGDSTDLRAEEARRVLTYVDSVWNAFSGLAAQIESTPKAELKGLKEYANMLPAPPPVEFFRREPQVPSSRSKDFADDGATPAPTRPRRAEGVLPGTVAIEAATARSADLSDLIDRAFVFDDLLADAQRLLLERWALQTPHWMLANSAHDEQGKQRHRIWGASYIQAWQRSGWTGLPPVLYSAIATILQQLAVTFTAPQYIGLNGQSRGQDAATHVDCTRDAPDQLSILVYIGEDTDGELLLHDKDDPRQIVDRIAFRPNRVVAFDGSIPHAARAPSDEKFRMSLIIRGTYEHQRSR